MIKCTWFLKSLKQLFIISLISCFGLLGSSFVNGEWIFHDVNEEFTVSNATTFTQKILSSSAWIVYGGWMSWKPLIVLQENGRRNSTTTYERRYIYFWWIDNKLYAYWNQDWNMSNPSNFEYLRFDSLIRYSWTWFVNKDYAWLNDSPWEVVSADSFYNDTQLKNAMTRYAYLLTPSNVFSNSYTAFCWIYDNLGFSICVKPAGAITTTLDSVNWLSIDPVEFDTSLLWTSPWVFNVPDNPTNPDIWYNDNLDNVNTNTFTWNDLINYYENNPNFKFNKNICYIWTNDLTSLYEDWIPYFEWQWKTIFELYSHLYWQNNNTPLNEIWKFMNAWWINYATWFEWRNRNWVDNSVVYNANYSLSSWFYLTYNNLTNPFVNNLSALFFMASNITSYTPSLEAQWDEVALYCYYKLWTENNSRIVEWDEFKSYRESVWSYTVQARRNSGYFSGVDSIVSQSWYWTPLDYFTWDDDLEFNTFFNKSFNRFTSVFDDFDISNIPWLWILPWYILVSLLWLIFFRFLSH